MQEVKGTEINEIKKPEPENFKNINPENGTTEKECRDFWDNEFNEIKDNQPLVDEEQALDKECYDDSGVKFREGDELLPNNTFEKNGFEFTTDDKGRVVGVEGKLEIPKDLEPRDMPSMKKVGRGDELPGDERFHIIAHMFGAGDGIENLVPGDAKLNHGDYLKMENMLKDAIIQGADVRLKVEPVYKDDSNRPSEFRATYSIDGERDTIVFKNGRGD